ncbi:MAG: hypothetical protein ACTSRC_20435 [Candidatus Helarchaeota archaeon]
MRLIRELKNYKPLLIIVTGDGRRDIKIFEELCSRFNGLDKIIWYPTTIIKKPTGLSALNRIKHLSSLYQIKFFIFIVDGEYIQVNVNSQIQNYLRGIGINVIEIEPIQEAFLINCKIGSHNVTLYCIILGPETFLEEEIIRLIELELDIPINLAGNRDSIWKDRIKKEIKQTLRENHTNVEDLIRNARVNNLNNAFPNLCVVFRNIEKDC